MDDKGKCIVELRRASKRRSHYLYKGDDYPFSNRPVP
jgi:hypothetical protein